ncbi:phage head closure protein [Virgibacillus siamensis]|uniref:phage head closure protein n=1 Tax=Virgibacillus siamensis TaxID=480071 RepID=UPI000985B6B8|nr:phage head closure protein [Virgibacillus siamensis]
MFPHNITFQTYTEVDDGMGGKIKTWADAFNTVAHVQPVNSSEYVEARKLVNPIDHNIFFPYIAQRIEEYFISPVQTNEQDMTVSGNMRVKWNDRTDSKGNNFILELRSNPLDQGGMGEIMMVKAELK